MSQGRTCLCLHLFGIPGVLGTPCFRPSGVFGKLKKYVKKKKN
jgi:hypothetical protein